MVYIWLMFHRLAKLSKSQSFFLFGARGTGKSELLKNHFSKGESLYIDLLDPELALRLSAYPNDILGMIEGFEGKKKWVIIDEIQKAPQLLEIVHKKISEKSFNFALTGSSARKLRRGSSNLLAGRAVLFNLFPLTHLELKDEFDLQEVLTFGSLPELYSLTSELDKKRFLKSYAQTYLKEEIIEEQIVRNLPPFKRFLDTVCTYDTEIINFTNVARDISTDPKTVMRYYEILEDTLLGFYLPSYDTSIRKQQKKSKKFYFFDTGIVRVLSQKIDIPVSEKTYEYGKLFENFIVNEINRILSYQELQYNLSFLRISETQEIDLIIQKSGVPTHICEIKSSSSVDERSARTLNLLEKDFKNIKALVISNDPEEKKFGKVRALHWKQAISEICNL
jgi:uncharacterized protein